MALLIYDHLLSIEVSQKEKHAVHLHKKHIIPFIIYLTAIFFVHSTTVETVAYMYKSLYISCSQRTYNQVRERKCS